MKTFLSVVAVVAALATSVGTVPSSAATDGVWTQVSSKATGGISGIAAATDGWVVVRDNKKAGQNRVAVLDGAGILTELTWPGPQPVDLEAIAAVPGRPGVFATMTSAGSGHIISVSAGSVVVNRVFALPRGTRNIEGFALAEESGTMIAVWAMRGSSRSPAIVYAANFMPDSGTFGALTSAKVTVPYPRVAARQVSDLTVASGRLIGSSASDPGGSGPFSAALYDLGSLSESSGRAALVLDTPLQLGVYDHKVEGIACSGTSGILGSDDEKLGGWTAMEEFCG